VLNGLGKRWQQVGAVILVAAIVVRFAILGSEWASGWMAALVALAVIVFVTNRRLFWSVPPFSVSSSSRTSGECMTR
jgi:hypothetical protein